MKWYRQTLLVVVAIMACESVVAFNGTNDNFSSTFKVSLYGFNASGEDFKTRDHNVVPVLPYNSTNVTGRFGILDDTFTVVDSVISKFTVVDLESPLFPFKRSIYANISLTGRVQSNITIVEVWANISLPIGSTIRRDMKLLNGTDKNGTYGTDFFGSELGRYEWFIVARRGGIGGDAFEGNLTSFAIGVSQDSVVLQSIVFGMIMIGLVVLYQARSKEDEEEEEKESNKPETTEGIGVQ
jgi:hypothetical protein